METKKGAFNARNTAPKDVAETFIVPEKFNQISKFENSILIGPRGVGKTTLLKALTPAGLYYLKKRIDLADELNQLDPDYLPVYIPAQANWKGDSDIIKDSFDNATNRDQILNGIFVDHSLNSLIRALESSNKYHHLLTSSNKPPWAISIDSRKEELLCRNFSDAWQLERIQTSFIGLKLALIRRVNMYRSAIVSQDSDAAVALALNQPWLDVLEMFKAAIEIVEHIIGETQWSFNFDEMEIAPRSVISMLYENLRSWDQRAVLKFSLYPFVDFYSVEEKNQKSIEGPVDGQDYSSFTLTNMFAKSEDVGFTEKFIQSECVKRNITIYEFADYLNSSNAMKTRTYEGLRFQRKYDVIFDSAFNTNRDTGIVSWLKDRGIKSLEQAVNVKGENKRARTIRKIAPISEFRYYYLSHERAEKRGNSGRRSHKSSAYYHGYNQIVDLSEGNPRAIKFYINELLDAYENKESSVTAQNRIIKRNVDRFRALVASQTVPAEIDARDLENTLDFINKIGRLFAEGVFAEKLNPDLSFSAVFDKIDLQTKKLLEVAINSGALIVDNSSSATDLIFEVVGRRVRLSHRFAPYYPLPIILGSVKKLTTELLDDNHSGPIQSELFHWEET